MDLEQQLKDTYAERLDGLDATGGDLDAARRTGARLRVRRRVAVGGAALAVVAVAIGGSLLGTGQISIGPSDSRGEWRELPAAPLSPRAYAESVWTGQEVIVLGGETDPCPPTADCASPSKVLSDGAAYNPRTDSWREIPPAPVPVGSGDRLVVADGVVVLRDWRQGGSRWFTYEPDHNRWSRIDDVPEGIGDLPSAYGSKVYALVGGRVAVYDVRSFQWSMLPPEDHRAAAHPPAHHRDAVRARGHRARRAINGPEPSRRGRRPLRRHLLASVSGDDTSRATTGPGPATG